MRKFAGIRAAVAAAGVAAVAAAVFAAAARPAAHATPLDKIDHFVVVYEENHSFDNLYGGWEGVNGRANADAAHTTQVDQQVPGNPYPCLRQNDVNLVALRGVCGLPNTWFMIDPLIKPTDTTCPPPSAAFASANANGVLNGQGLPGGCTRDLVHRFYQEQYQLNGGRQNRYMVASDAMGLVMGQYDTTKLPIYTWLHSKNHPSYVIADDFFQAAFGGSFLNHQYLIAAQAPSDDAAPANLHSLLDSAGFPRFNAPLYTPIAPMSSYRDSDFTMACPAPLNLACGNFAVNTMQPSSEPSGTFGEKLVLQTNPTIGDRLTEKGLDWAWYSGGWADAAGLTTDPGYTNGPGPACANPNHDTNAKWHWPYCPDFLFQYHHQPFNYYANYAPGLPGRAHLQDEADFLNLVASSRKQGNDCDLKPVSFWKPRGAENEHPGYASTPRIPALIFAPYLKNGFGVDSTEHDTTSILKTIENRFGLKPLAWRDEHVSDLSSVWDARRVDNK